ncbi:MAG: T9SS type A sorting domain-containing protein [Bacteroidetes bacterium]|nr:T9SS type A sorting domain-containing protein [Bacteroidota bacterium]
MKKIFTLLSLITAGAGFAFAQNEKNFAADCETDVNAISPAENAILPVAKTNPEPYNASLLYDNGPLANFPGQGAGGADASATHDGLITYGFGHAVSSGYRVADDFTVPAGQTWTIDSLIFYAYQTNSGNTSTMTDVRLAVRNANPLTNANPSAIIWGDTTSNVLTVSYWSGIYRVTSATLTATSRPIMKNVVETLTPSLQLTSGQYWVDWQTGGSLSSGPWAPPVSYSVTTITGDAMQFNTSTWNSIIDTAQAGPGDDAPQGLPFKIYGTSFNGVNELYNNNNVSVYPNPMISSAEVFISDNIKKSSAGFSFNVFDLVGNLIRKTESIATNKFTIQKNQLPVGMYIYEVRNGTQIIKRGKLSVQDE